MFFSQFDVVEVHPDLERGFLVCHEYASFVLGIRDVDYAVFFPVCFVRGDPES